MTAALLVVTALIAVVDWIAVVRDRHRLEYLAKPLTLAVLIAAAASADLGVAKPWVIGALALGLLGDVALMFAGDSPDLWFMLGLGSFLLGHVSYLVAFTRHGLHSSQLLVGVLVVAVVAGLALPQVVRGASRAGGGVLAGAVTGYAGALAAMAVLAVGTGAVATGFGGVLFLISDALLARGRFVRPMRHGPLAVIVTYHAAQVLIVIGLIR